MNKTEKTKAIFDNGKMIRFVMLGIAVALSVKYIFVDFGIDAEFQISMSYRLAKGDIMFKEMWEPHQMSAFLCAFFIKIYLWLFHTTTGIVLYLQVIGVLLDAAVAYCFYQVVNKYLHCSNAAFAMAWVFFIVSPKDVPLPEYANMQVWFSALLCVTLFVYYKTEKKRWVILSALCLCGAVLAYPSCLLLFFGVIYYFPAKIRLVALFSELFVCWWEAYICVLFSDRFRSAILWFRLRICWRLRQHILCG